jgi:hypothetical protein
VAANTNRVPRRGCGPGGQLMLGLSVRGVDDVRAGASSSVAGDIRVRASVVVDDDVRVESGVGDVCADPAAVGDEADGGPSAGSGIASSGDGGDKIDRLRRLLVRFEDRRSRAGRDGTDLVATGIGPLDIALGGGLRRGSVVEVLSGGWGTGARTLAMRVAVAASIHSDDASARVTPSVSCADTSSANQMSLSDRISGASAVSFKWIVVVDRDGDFYPPAAVSVGVCVQRMMVVRADRESDALWATDQALRCESVGAVIATRLCPDAARSRRLQLAAERSGVIGLILMPDRRQRHTFAALQMRVDPVPLGAVDDGGSRSRVDSCLAFALARRCRITLTKTRDRRPVEPIVVGWSDESIDVSSSSVSFDRSVSVGVRRTA